MQHFWHQKQIFGFSTSAGVFVEEKPNAFREMLGDETSRKFPAMFCQIWFDWMSGHLKGCLWWQNWVFLTRPQDLSTGVHGRRTPDIFWWVGTSLSMFVARKSGVFIKTMSQFPSVFVTTKLDNKTLGHHQLYFWQQNRMFITRPQDISLREPQYRYFTPKHVVR